MKISGARKLEKSKFFPCYFGFRLNYKSKVLIGVGGNIGNNKVRFDKLLRILKEDRRFHIVETSPILINKAFGYENQSDFSNAVIGLQTSLGPNELLKITQYYEKKFKRERRFKNAPRTLDLDILYMNKKVRKSPKLVVPHSGADNRISVIVPLGLMKS